MKGIEGVLSKEEIFSTETTIMSALACCVNKEGCQSSRVQCAWWSKQYAGRHGQGQPGSLFLEDKNRVR